MITPSEFKKMSDNNAIVNMYTKLNQELTNEIIRTIKNTGDISDYTKHQLKVLIKIGGKKIFNDALLKTQKLTNKRKKEIKDLFNELLDKSYNGYEKTYELKDKEFEISDEAIEIVDKIIKTTNEELKNLTKTIAFESKKEYVNAMDNLYKKIISGGWSYEKSIKSTIIDLTKKGVTLSDGYRNYTLENFVRNGVLSSLKKTTNDISKIIKDDIGANCVVIGHSSKCRPTHHVIDEVVMSLELFEKDYEYLTKEYNCNHIVNYDWREEFENKKDKIEYEEDKIDYDKNLKRYEEQQTQNALARNVRAKKKEIASLGNVSKDILYIKKKQLKNAQIKYRTYSIKKNLPVDYSQTWEAGYNGLKKGY